MIQIFVKKNYPKQWALWWWLWWCGITVQRQEDGGRKMKMSSQAALQDMSKLDHVRLKGSLKMFVSWNQKDSKYLNIGTVQHCTLLGHLCKTLVGVCSVVIFPQIMNIIAAYWRVKMCKNYSISCKWGHKNHNSTIVFPLMKINIRSLPLWRLYL